MCKYLNVLQYACVVAKFPHLYWNELIKHCHASNMLLEYVVTDWLIDSLYDIHFTESFEYR